MGDMEDTGTATVEAAPSTEHQETVTQKETLASVIDATKTELEEKQPAPVEDGAEKSKGPKKQTVGDRISHYAQKAKDAEAGRQAAEAAIAESKQAMDELRAELAEIKANQARGTISPGQAQAQEEDARDAFQKSLDGLELPKELMPYRDNLAEVARRIAEAAISPIMAERKAAKESERVNMLKSNFTTMETEFPELFTGQKDKNGLPLLKPEYDAQAMELMKHLNVYTKEGLHLLMKSIYAGVDKANAVKQQLDVQKEGVEKAKALRVESPESRSMTPKRDKTLTEIIDEAKKEVGYKKT